MLSVTGDPTFTVPDSFGLKARSLSTAAVRKWLRASRRVYVGIRIWPSKYQLYAPTLIPLLRELAYTYLYALRSIRFIDYVNTLPSL